MSSLSWVIWFQHRSPGSKTANYESGIKRISSFSSIESFWSLFTHLNPPSSLTPTTDYLLFHSAVKRPVWEDPVNERGGKWIVRLKKGVADRIWEEMVLALIGDQFMPERGERVPEDWWAPDEICGCTISVRSNEDILAVWHKTGSDEAIRVRIRYVLAIVFDASLMTQFPGI
jgi:translation initiation factor 4E